MSEITLTDDLKDEILEYDKKINININNIEEIGRKKIVSRNPETLKRIQELRERVEKFKDASRKRQARGEEFRKNLRDQRVKNDNQDNQQNQDNLKK
jgi:hypothetical protein